jgi:hypothetical protein
MHAYFTTEKFRQEVADDEIDKVVLGEDCIAWLRSQLDRCPGIATERPLFEDWGWTMALSVDGSPLWVNVQDWSFERARTWHLWAEPRGLLARLIASRHRTASGRLRQLLDEILSAEQAIRDLRWSELPP